MYKDELYGQIGDFNLPSLSHKLALLQEGWIDLPDSSTAEESAKLKVKIKMVEAFLARFETKSMAVEAMLKLNLSREDGISIIEGYWRESRCIRIYGYLRF